MEQIQTTGQEIAKMFALMAALLSGEMVKTTTFREGVEIIGISRMNYPEASVYVEMATPHGHRSYGIDEIELVES